MTVGLIFRGVKPCGFRLKVNEKFVIIHYYFFLNANIVIATANSDRNSGSGEAVLRSEVVVEASLREVAIVSRRLRVSIRATEDV
jgi:hypothetical protein